LSFDKLLTLYSIDELVETLTGMEPGQNGSLEVNFNPHQDLT